MSDQDIKRLQDLALDKLKKGFTREEALQSLVNAGILDEKGDFTKPYKNLATAMSQ
jgi:hypothetical protein